jgi:fermentation-respiration switch protein FrsA (DUF1100 family)
MGTIRRAGIAAAIAAAPVGLAYRFALAYRVRAGYPRRNLPRITPADLGLPYEAISVDSAGQALPGWFIPARDGTPGPAVVLVHGWESARDRALPMAVFLHAAGFHCLVFDVRGHGANPAEAMPLTAGEFGADTLAAFHALLARPGAVAAVRPPGRHRRDPTARRPAGGRGRELRPGRPVAPPRLTFRLAHLPLPDPIAYPLAWLTTRVFLRPRGHDVTSVSATRAIGRYRGPVLLAHGELDEVVPLGHMARLAAAARAGRGPGGAPVETLTVRDCGHSWLYEDAGYRRVVARFLATALGGPLDPEAAGEVAAATHAERIPDGESPLTALEDTPGGFRTLVQVALPGATRTPVPAPLDAGSPPPGPEPSAGPG